jgi:hypothetical protein
MKCLIFIKVALVCACSIPFILQAQQKQSNKKTNKSMTAIVTKPDEIILSELNAQFIKNFLTQDTAEHNKIIHKDFICIEASGAIVSRDVYLDNWATDFDNSGYQSFTYDDQAIRIFGNMALVRAKTTYTKLVAGETVKGYTIYTDTYIKENGDWKCVQVQITPVAR